MSQSQSQSSEAKELEGSAQSQENQTKASSSLEDSEKLVLKKRKSITRSSSAEIPLRKSSRIAGQQKEKEKNGEDEEYMPPPKKTSSATKKKRRLSQSQTESQETELASSSTSTQAHPLSQSQSQTPSQSQSQSQNGLQTLAHNYSEGQSLDFNLQTYQRNKTYFSPLGKLSAEQIKQGYEVLDQLKAKIKEFAKVTETENKKKLDSELLDLSNQFYSIIPSQDLSRLPKLDTEDLLNEKYTLLKSMHK